MNRKNAFTLIELLVVVSIIAVLIGLFLPALSAARRRGQQTTCQTRLHELSRAIWAYSSANDNRVPYVHSPMTNQTFGALSALSDAETNPYDRERWPMSIQNVLMPLYVGEDNRRIFQCPTAIKGWPRFGGGLQMTYRDAGANQPNGAVEAAGGYLREAFGFLDGRPMVELRVHFTGNFVTDAQKFSYTRGSYLRDMVVRDGTRLVGPHDGGINVINREFGVEFRDNKTIQADLNPFGSGVQF